MLPWIHMADPINPETSGGRSRFAGFRNRFFGRRGTPTPTTPGVLTDEGTVTKAHIEGVITDQKLLQYFFKERGIDAHAIATDSFLDKSRDEYNSAWLTRELVQNFVDHNPQDPGTLNGVRFRVEDARHGAKRFRIEGDWPFEDPTGVLSPHSDKPENMNTAGGNGIGLKQTAIRFLRDFGVQKFQIQGEGWTVDYRLAKAADVNREWASLHGYNPAHAVKHDWLLADVQEAPRTGRNAYIIETDNPEVIRALQQLPTLGVSRENPYLQDMDYQNRYGAIKWLPRSTGLVPTRGRLFINGQVMNYKEKGTTADNYWIGPEGITIRLNDLEYRMSIDRPPVTAFDLGYYLDGMVGAMEKSDLIGQVKRSEYIWAGNVDTGYSFDRKGAFVVIEKLVGQLPYRGYDKAKYQQLFGGKNYIAWDRGVTESQIHEFEEKGYIICPSYMESIGMPRASSKLSSAEAASNEMPSLPKYQMEQFAQEYGMEVFHEDFSTVKGPAEFISQVGQRLTPEVTAVEQREGKPNIFRIRLKGDIQKDLLFHALPRPREDDQKLLYLLRGVAAYGLSSGILKKIFTSQGEFVTTFGLNYDFITKENTLLARNIQNESEEGLFVELELEDRYIQSFKDAFQRTVARAEVGIPQIPQGIVVETTSPVTDVVLPSTETKNQEVSDIDLDQAIALRVWTTEQERLYQAAIKKNVADLSEEEKLIIQQREQLKKAFGQVPVSQPAVPEVESKGLVVDKEATMPDTEKARVEQMEAQLPGILEAVNKLEGLVPEVQPQALTGAAAIEKYLQWRNSEQFYGQLSDNAGYLTGRHLFELINEQNQAEIASVNVIRDESPEDKILGALKGKLSDIADRMGPAEDEVDDFEIVFDPNERQLAQLGILRLYTQLTTSVVLPNDLFLYRGTGSKGINLGQKAIGMHESLFNTQFTEAMSTFVHEIAHNWSMDHGNEFRHAMQSLFVTVIDRVSQIANKSLVGETISQEERVIVDIQREWDKLKVV